MQYHTRVIDALPFDLFNELLGCRTDDPRLIELHQTYGLKPVPTFKDRRSPEVSASREIILRDGRRTACAVRR
jgi:hypothetical protein